MAIGSLAHRHEFFGARRVDRNGVVEVGLARAHPQRDREPLQHLVGTSADDVQADDPLVGTDAREQHGNDVKVTDFRRPMYYAVTERKRRTDMKLVCVGRRRRSSAATSSAEAPTR